MEIKKLITIENKEDWEDMRLACKAIDSTMKVELNNIIRSFNDRNRVNIELMKRRKK